MITTTIVTRERECGGCRRCGRALSQWERGITMEEALAAVFAQPDLLEPMLFRRCARCGAPYEWDVAIFSDEREELPSTAAGRGDELDRAIRGHLVRSTPASEAAELIRRRLGVEGIFIEEGSEVEREMTCTGDRRGPPGSG